MNNITIEKPIHRIPHNTKVKPHLTCYASTPGVVIGMSFPIGTSEWDIRAELMTEMLIRLKVGQA